MTLVTPIPSVPSRGEALTVEGDKVSEDALQGDVGGQLFDCGSYQVKVKVNASGFAEGQLSLTSQDGQTVGLDFSNVPALYLDVPSYQGPTMPDGNAEAPPPIALRIL